MVSCCPSVHPETTTLRRASLHRGGTKVRYKESQEQDKTPRTALPASLEPRSCWGVNPSLNLSVLLSEVPLSLSRDS